MGRYLGLGNDVPISTGNENDALLALVDGKCVVLRVPYLLSFYAKGLGGGFQLGWTIVVRRRSIRQEVDQLD